MFSTAWRRSQHVCCELNVGSSSEVRSALGEEERAVLAARRGVALCGEVGVVLNSPAPRLEPDIHHAGCVLLLPTPELTELKTQPLINHVHSFLKPLILLHTVVFLFFLLH